MRTATKTSPSRTRASQTRTGTAAMRSAVGTLGRCSSIRTPWPPTRNPEAALEKGSRWAPCDSQPVRQSADRTSWPASRISLQPRVDGRNRISRSRIVAGPPRQEVDDDAQSGGPVERGSKGRAASFTAPGAAFRNPDCHKPRGWAAWPARRASSTRRASTSTAARLRARGVPRSVQCAAITANRSTSPVDASPSATRIADQAGAGDVGVGDRPVLPIQVGRTVVHQAAPTLEEITACVGRLGGILYRVGERGLDHFAGCVRQFRGPVPEARPEPMWHGGDAEFLDQFR